MKYVVPGPLSIQRSKWDNVDYFIPNYFAKDFCHHNLFTVKVKALSREATLISLKRVFAAEGAQDKMKLWVALNKPHGHLYLLYDKDRFKIHYEHDLINLNQRELCLYSSLSLFKNGRYSSFKLGCDYFGELYRLNNVVKIGPKYDTTLYSRFLSYLQDIKIGGQVVTDLMNQRCLKKDLFMWYSIKKYSFQFKINQDWNQELGFQGKIFNRFTTTVIHKDADKMVGLEVEVSKRQNKLSKVFSGLFDWRVNEKSRLKVKVDDQMIGTFLVELNLLNNVQLGIGGQVPLKEKSKGFKFGAKVSLNV